MNVPVTLQTTRQIDFFSNLYVFSVDMDRRSVRTPNQLQERSATEVVQRVPYTRIQSSIFAIHRDNQGRGTQTVWRQTVKNHLTSNCLFEHKCFINQSCLHLKKVILKNMPLQVRCRHRDTAEKQFTGFHALSRTEKQGVFFQS